MIFNRNDDVSHFNKVVDVYTSISGLSNKKSNFTGVWQVIYWDKSKKYKLKGRQYFTESTIHRAFTETIAKGIIDAIAIYPFSNDKDVLIRVHHYDWNLEQVVISRSWEKWKFEGTEKTIIRPKGYRLKNADLWIALLFMAETVNIQFVELDEYSDIYKELLKEAKDYFNKTFKIQKGGVKPPFMESPRKNHPRESIFTRKVRLQKKILKNKESFDSEQRIKELEKKIKQNEIY